VSDTQVPHSGLVAVVGRPNVGKSTLVNALVGEKVSIVSDKPQTTRNRILAVVNRPEGQMVLLDTPGVHKPLHAMNENMVELALESLKSVEVALWVVDATEGYSVAERHVREALHRCGKPVVLGLNKIDRIEKPKLLPMIDSYRNMIDFAEVVPLSALKGENVELLASRLMAHLPAGEPLYPADVLTDLPERFFVSERIREQVLNHTREELPYATAVIIENFVEEADEARTRIDAVILVDKDSQKAIVIGKGGSMLKAIGTAARQEIEKFLGVRVYLQLFVKVRKGWRDDPRMLSEIGLDTRSGR
jgi:GTP-binding protein Era